MIPFFVGYALAVWIPAAKFRRCAIGVAIVVAGALVLGLLAAGHYQLRIVRPTLYIQGMQVMLYPYSVMVIAVGAFIVALPRFKPGMCPHCHAALDPRAAEPRCAGCDRWLVPERCPVCRYDLGAQEPQDRVCPECGFDFVSQTRASGDAAPAFATSPPEPRLARELVAAGVSLAPRQAPHAAQAEDRERQTRDQ